MHLTTRRKRTALAVVVAASLPLGGSAAAWRSAHPYEATTQWAIEAQTDGFARHTVVLASQERTGEGSTRGRALPRVRQDLDIEKLARAQQEIGTGGQVVVGGDDQVYYLQGDEGRVVSRGDAWEVDPTTVQGYQDIASAPEAPAPATAPEVTWPSAAPATEPADTRPDDGIAPMVTYAPATAEQIEALENTPGVEHVQQNADNTLLVTSSLTTDELGAVEGVDDVEESVFVPVLGAEPTDPQFTYAWHLHNTGWAYQQAAVAGSDVAALSGWEGSLGQGAVVAVVDTGYTTTHPDLQGQLWNNPSEACGSTDQNGNGKAGDCHGWNFYSDNADLDNGTAGSHGTSVSGVVAATMNNAHGATGLAPGARIMPLVVGSGTSVNVDMAAQAIRYAADNGADVINASFGGNFSGTSLQRLKDAVVYANTKNVLVVAAAGNDRLDRDTNPVYPASFSEPNVITVGSTNATDAVATHSAYGKTTVDLFAPGELVYTTWNDGGYRLSTGTSLAAPQVAAAAALHTSVDPDLGAADLRTLLMSTSTKKSQYTDKSVSGGRLSVAGLGGGDTSADYTFSRMGVQPTGTQRPQVTVSTTSSGGPYSVMFGLLMNHENAAWGVGDVPVTFQGQTTSTAADGTVTFPLGDTVAAGALLEPTFSLPEGQYALAVQVAESGVGLGRPVAAPLTITDTPTPGPTGIAPGPGGGDSGADPAPNPTRTAPAPAPDSGGGGGGGGGGTDPAPGPEPDGSGPDPAPGPDDDSIGPAPGPGSGGGGGDPAPEPDDDSTDPAPGPDRSGGGAGPAPAPDNGDGDGDGDGGNDPGPAPGPGGTTPAPDPTSTTPGGDTSEKLYPGTDTFQVTRVTPHRVSHLGGDLVRIEGGDLPGDLRVRVGTSTVADIVGGSVGSSTSITIEVPAMVPGTYDMTLSTPGGRVSVLSDALVVENRGGTDPGDTAPAPDGGGDDGGTDPAPGPGSTIPAPTPSTTTPPPGSGNGTATGPHGQKLSRSPLGDTAPSSLWTISGCETSCTGVQL